MIQSLLYLLLIWFSTLLVGFVSWPAAALFFGRFSDRGYTIAKISGWIILSYLLFLFATLKILPLHIGSLLLVIILWIALNVFLERRFRILRQKPFDWKQIALIEISFFALMAFMAFIRGHNPELSGVERFMDFGFIQTLFNVNTLPLADMWFLGESVNYYYFGHFMGYVILSLSNISSVPGFFVLIAWMFGLLGIAVYRLGRDFAGSMRAGFISFFFVMLAGTWHITVWLFGYLKHLFFHAPAPNFWYPDATRIIPGAITEMPIYGFLEADLHPHTWGWFHGVLVLAILYTLWKSNTHSLNLKNPYLWLLSLVLGISYMTNAWDAATLGLLSLAVLFLKFRSSPKRILLLWAILLPVFSYIVALPWAFFYHAPVEGLGIVKSRSPFLPWISFWGPILSLIVLFLYGAIRTKWRAIGFFSIVIATTIVFILLIELVYVKDLFSEGDHFRVNTVYKVSNQLWLWMGVLSGGIMIWVMQSMKTKKARIALTIILALLLSTQAVYPIKALWQARLENKEYTGFSSGLDWWKQRFPYDFEAYVYLAQIRDTLPSNDRLRNIVEANGDSFTDESRFSVFLGWPTIIGWANHEWTWRGSYDVASPRIEEVKEIYTGQNKTKAQEILQKYAIDYIIVGEVEQKKYQDQLKREKIMSLGDVVFQNAKTMIVQTR